MSNDEWRPTKGDDGNYRDPVGHVLIPSPGSMYWRGQHFAGLYCAICNSLYDNPEDSMMEAARASATRADIETAARSEQWRPVLDAEGRHVGEVDAPEPPLNELKALVARVREGVAIGMQEAGVTSPTEDPQWIDDLAMCNIIERLCDDLVVAKERADNDIERCRQAFRERDDEWRREVDRLRSAGEKAELQRDEARGKLADVYAGAREAALASSSSAGLIRRAIPAAFTDDADTRKVEFCDVCPHNIALHNADGSCGCGMNCAAIRADTRKGGE